MGICLTSYTSEIDERLYFDIDMGCPMMIGPSYITNNTSWVAWNAIRFNQTVYQVMREKCVAEAFGSNCLTFNRAL